jgi:redox-sensitive bicupin YhaK (pirin superfamily)
LEHADTMGNRRTIEPGEVQAMSAGTGLFHSEYNPSPDQPVHLFQIWIMPALRGVQPGYDQKSFEAAGRNGQFQTLASADGEAGSLVIHADAKFLVADLAANQKTSYEVGPRRGVWVQVAQGAVTINGEALAEGDGAAIEGETLLAFEASSDSHLLLFDLK